MKLTASFLCTASVLGALFATVLPNGALAASIGLFSTPDCTSCNLTIPQFQQGTFYISFTGVPSTPAFASVGMGAAEFRVEGVPAGWLTNVQPTLAAQVVVGDPLHGGTNIAFASPQTGDCILLFTVTLTAISTTNDVLLYVTRHTNPSNPNFLLCPNANPWDPPVWGGRQCVGGDAMRLNSQQDCQVAVRSQTWSGVRRLFN